MKWFRFYDEVLDDPKCQRLPPALFKHWINMLCIANRSNTRGVLPALEDIAFSLRLSQAKTKSVLGELQDAGLVDELEDGSLAPHGWSQRQRSSDNVAERVTRYRQRNVAETDLESQESVTETDLKPECNVTETLPHVRATDTDSETETETETEVTVRANARTPSAGAEPVATSSHGIDSLQGRFERFWATYPRKVGKDSALRWWMRTKPDEAFASTIIAAVESQKQSAEWTKDAGQYIPYPTTWLGRGGWKDQLTKATEVASTGGDALARRRALREARSKAS